MRRPLLRSAVLSSLVVLACWPPTSAAAQASGESTDPFHPADPEVSDAEVVRWARQELSREESREAIRRPPVPPYSYLVHGAEPNAEVPGPDDGIRLLAEVGTGAAGLLIGGGVGALLVWAAVEAGADPNWLMAAGAGGVLLAALGVAGGVALGGDATGGRANFGHAFLGQAFGSVVALPLVTLAMANEAPEALLAVGLLPLAGAVLGYELAHALSGSSGDGPVVAWLTLVRDGALGVVTGAL